jgi:hypothetical protein
VLKALEQDIIRILARKLITEPLANSIAGAINGTGGGGSGSFIGSLISSFFGGGKAIGGATMPNTMYQVGERRPEVFSDG